MIGVLIVAGADACGFLGYVVFSAAENIEHFELVHQRRARPSMPSWKFSGVEAGVSKAPMLIECADRLRGHNRAACRNLGRNRAVPFRDCGTQRAPRASTQSPRAEHPQARRRNCPAPSSTSGNGRYADCHPGSTSESRSGRLGIPCCAPRARFKPFRRRTARSIRQAAYLRSSETERPVA